MTFLYAIIILLTYIGIAVGRVPMLRMNRTTITLVGAAALLAFGAITQAQALHAIDLATIMLLFGMMVLNANLRLAGFFNLVGDRVLRLAHSPRVLLALVVIASGVLSAVFLNDPVCLLFTPLVVTVTQRAGRNPVPYLIGLATAANVGSTATITGNPQNVIIGQASGISYLNFLLHLAPIALIGLFFCWLLIVLIYPGEFHGKMATVKLPPPQTYPQLLNRTILIVIGLLIAFLLGAPIASAAFIAASLLFISRLRPGKLLEIEWDLLVFFAALFIVTGAIETTGISNELFKLVAPIINSGTAAFSAVTVVLSNLVSNVPAVLLFRPIIPTLANPERAWLTLAMASTLAGNLTLLGSVANLIVAEVAGVRGVKITFVEYLKVGLPLTLITVVIGVLWLSIT